MAGPFSPSESSRGWVAPGLNQAVGVGAMRDRHVRQAKRQPQCDLSAGRVRSLGLSASLGQSIRWQHGSRAGWSLCEVWGHAVFLCLKRLLWAAPRAAA